ncbi:MAG: hypothetical protein ALECFALPRED_010360 [Alectoria fallacina]|uniref:Uncharacterized protein n=1 Tax=Alectoria fallacina TaxID=1903189 RepID=A0A8H3J9P2_9LECA|nr:MAG: hypothetical protein ALECFALPRED_010360 [Alectoria fallacina]
MHPALSGALGSESRNRAKEHLLASLRNRLALLGIRCLSPSTPSAAPETLKIVAGGAWQYPWPIMDLPEADLTWGTGLEEKKKNNLVAARGAREARLPILGKRKSGKGKVSSRRAPDASGFRRGENLPATANVVARGIGVYGTYGPTHGPRKS